MHSSCDFLLPFTLSSSYDSLALGWKETGKIIFINFRYFFLLTLFPWNDWVGSKYKKGILNSLNISFFFNTKKLPVGHEK